MIEIRVLQYLIAVVDCGTVAGAAREIRVAQPSLSRQIRGLERSVGFEIFDRSTTRFQLTAAGRSFVQEARGLVRHANETEAAAHRLATGVPTKLTISASMTAITEVLASFVARSLTEDDPHIDFMPVLPTEGFSPLDTGADFAIASAPPLGRHSVQLLGQVPLFAQFPPGHAWSARSHVHVRELADQPLVLLDQDHRTRALVDRVLSEAGVTYHSYVESHVPKVAQALAAAGRGVVVLTDLPTFGLDAVQLHNDGGPIHVRIHAAWMPSHFAAEEISRLALRIRDYYTERLATASKIGQHNADA